MDKLYLVTRGDLKPGAQLAQSCHAMAAIAARFPAQFASWHDGSNNLVALRVADENALQATIARLATLGCCYTEFREPDFDGQLTACAVIGANAKRALSSLPLALKD